MATAFTELVGCERPLQLAAMGGGVTTLRLARAVAAAGGLGMVSGLDLGADGVAELGDRAGWPDAEQHVGVGFLMPFLDLAALEAAAAVASVVECFYGEPDASVVARATGGGALASWQVGSADEARAAVDAGCHFVIAQGVEAGGHVRGDLGARAVLDQVLGVVDVPVLAAGGIGTAADVAARLDAGAAGVRVGTRFLVAEEAEVHPDYRAALLAADASDTVLTTDFGVFWPDAPHRVLRASQALAAARSGPESGAVGADGTPIPLHSPAPPAASVTGEVGALAQYAGESVGAAHAVVPAAEIVDELVGSISRP
jgi:NAD(P)H-dependent flavin oxidoreductase YrpB (nitropropane dioxygenase family)